MRLVWCANLAGYGAGRAAQAAPTQQQHQHWPLFQKVIIPLSASRQVILKSVQTGLSVMMLPEASCAGMQVTRCSKAPLVGCIIIGWPNS